jgi:hypothetical protein
MKGWNCSLFGRDRSMPDDNMYIFILVDQWLSLLLPTQGRKQDTRQRNCGHDR